MRHRGVVVLLGAAGLLLAGCTAPVSPRPSESGSATAVRTPTPSPVPSLAVPGRLPGEIARTVVTPRVDRADSGDFPRDVRQLFVHLRCTGPSGSSMRYEVLHGDGSPFGPSGTWSCDRTPGVIEDQSDRAFARAVQVRLQVDRGVTTAWAVVSTSSEGE